ncbi:MAG: UDP-3-O-(3-hydroxymyristoyl)glucosamine N-acyltransferase [Candidatus Marinimicrobia bacterium]|nr:UDP-3-O-(3-hydroxymyristoyl)glucosamine N-acyltransferase [Candidatus Neomarinimicrobiota bacterium]
MTERTVREIAEQLGASCVGEEDLVIRGVAGVHDARREQITFIANKRYAAAAAETQAGCILAPLDWDRPCSAALIRVPNPDQAFAIVAGWFAPPEITPPPGVHPSAIIAPDAEVDPSASIGPQCVIEPGARIGPRSILQAQNYIGHESRIGADCRLYPQVTLRERSVLGDRVIIHNGAVIGSDGFGYTVNDQGVRAKIPQIGRVIIGDDVEIGANTTIDRARFGATRIGNGVKIDNLVQIAHNVVIGDHAVIVALVGIAGSTTIGPTAILAGQSGVAGHLTVGAGAIVGGRSGVTKNVSPKTYVSGFPAQAHDQETRVQALTRRLPEIKERLDDFARRIQQLESRKKERPG